MTKNMKEFHNRNIVILSSYARNVLIFIIDLSLSSVFKLNSFYNFSAGTENDNDKCTWIIKKSFYDKNKTVRK